MSITSTNSLNAQDITKVFWISVICLGMMVLSVASSTPTKREKENSFADGDGSCIFILPRAKFFVYKLLMMVTQHVSEQRKVMHMVTYIGTKYENISSDAGTLGLGRHRYPLQLLRLCPTPVHSLTGSLTGILPHGTVYDGGPRSACSGCVDGRMVCLRYLHSMALFFSSNGTGTLLQ